MSLSDYSSQVPQPVSPANLMSGLGHVMEPGEELLLAPNLDREANPLRLISAPEDPAVPYIHVVGLCLGMYNNHYQDRSSGLTSFEEIEILYLAHPENLKRGRFFLRCMPEKTPLIIPVAELPDGVLGRELPNASRFSAGVSREHVKLAADSDRPTLLTITNLEPTNPTFLFRTDYQDYRSPFSDS